NRGERAPFVLGAGRWLNPAGLLIEGFLSADGGCILRRVELCDVTCRGDVTSRSGIDGNVSAHGRGRHSLELRDVTEMVGEVLLGRGLELVAGGSRRIDPCGRSRHRAGQLAITLRIRRCALAAVAARDADHGYHGHTADQTRERLHSSGPFMNLR